MPYHDSAELGIHRYYGICDAVALGLICGIAWASVVRAIGQIFVVQYALIIALRALVLALAFKVSGFGHVAPGIPIEP